MEQIRHIWVASTACFATWLLVGMMAYHISGRLFTAAVVAAGFLLIATAISLHTHPAQTALTISTAALAATGVAIAVAGFVLREQALYLFGGGCFFAATLFALFVVIAAEEDGHNEHSALLFFAALPLGLGFVLGRGILLLLPIVRRWQAGRALLEAGRVA